MTTTTELTLFAEYFQIHVSDADSDGDLSDAWTDQAVADHLAVASDALGIGTVGNVNVSVTVVVLPQEPSDDSSEFDHVVEASLDVSLGRLTVLGCTDYAPDAATFEVASGWNRVRVCSVLPGSAVDGMGAHRARPYGPAVGNGAPSIPVPADPPPEASSCARG